MAALVSYQQAKDHLRYTTDDASYDILLKMEQATAIVLDYLSDYIAREEPVWTVDTDPSTDAAFAMVQAAILDVLRNLDRFRGDEEKPVEGPMTARVERMLRGLHDPPLA